MSAREFGDECIVRGHLHVDRDGHPHIWVGAQNVNVGVARLVYRAYVGEVPTGAVVSHRCGNKLCINPRHLYLRSQSEAGADQGARQKLTAAEHWYIRHSPLSLKQLAAKLDQSSGNLSRIRAGKRGVLERYSLRYALLVLWEHITRQGRRQSTRGES
jgi:hypothetical protein